MRAAEVLSMRAADVISMRNPRSHQSFTIAFSQATYDPLTLDLIGIHLFIYAYVMGPQP